MALRTVVVQVGSMERVTWLESHWLGTREKRIFVAATYLYDTQKLTTLTMMPSGDGSPTSRGEVVSSIKMLRTTSDG